MGENNHYNLTQIGRILAYLESQRKLVGKECQINGYFDYQLAISHPFYQYYCSGIKAIMDNLSGLGERDVDEIMDIAMRVEVNFTHILKSYV